MNGKKSALLIAIILCFLLCACGSNPVPNNTPAQTGPSTEATEKVVTWQEQYDLGVRYLTEGKYQEAILAFTAAIKIDPKQAAVYIGRGDAYAARAETDAKYYADAIADYRTAVETDGEQPEVFVKLGDLYVLTEEPEEAIGAYSAALELDERMTVAYVGRGNLYLQKAEALKAETDELQKTDDESEEEFEARKEALLAERDALYESAKADYLQALELEPQQPELYEKTADIYLALDDYNAAVDLLEKGAELTGDEALRRRLEKLTKDRSRTMTVTGEIINNMSEYADRYKQYQEEYGYINEESTGRRYPKLTIPIYGIRFSDPVEICMNGKTTTISEARLLGNLNEGMYTLTGFFLYDSEGEIRAFRPSSSSPNPYIEFIYYPNGSYSFVVQEISN